MQTRSNARQFRGARTTRAIVLTVVAPSTACYRYVPNSSADLQVGEEVRVRLRRQQNPEDGDHGAVPYTVYGKPGRTKSLFGKSECFRAGFLERREVEGLVLLDGFIEGGDGLGAEFVQRRTRLFH